MKLCFSCIISYSAMKTTLVWLPIDAAQFAAARTGQSASLDAAQLAELAAAQPQASPLVVFVDAAVLGMTWSGDCSTAETCCDVASVSSLKESKGYFRVVRSRAALDLPERRPVQLRPGSHVFVKLPWETHLRVSTAVGAFGARAAARPRRASCASQAPR